MMTDDIVRLCVCVCMCVLCVCLCVFGFSLQNQSWYGEVRSRKLDKLKRRKFPQNYLW